MWWKSKSRADDDYDLLRRSAGPVEEPAQSTPYNFRQKRSSDSDPISRESDPIAPPQAPPKPRTLKKRAPSTPLTRSKFKARKKERQSQTQVSYQGKQVPLTKVRKIVSHFQPTLPPGNSSYYEILLSSPEKPKMPKLNIRQYSPKGKENEILPVIFYVPGTAFITPPTTASHILCDQLATLTGCRVIRLDHSLAPDFKYDVMADQIYDSYQYIMRFAHNFNIDTEHVLIAGYSTGAYFASLTALRAAEDGIVVPKQLLISAIVSLASFNNNPYAKYETRDPLITEEYVHDFLQACKPLDVQLNECQSPLKYDSETVQALSECSLFVGEYDRFRGHSHAYAEFLNTNGVPATIKIIKGEGHAFFWQKAQTYVPEIAEQAKTLLGLNDVICETPPKAMGGSTVGGARPRQLMFDSPPSSDPAFIPESPTTSPPREEGEQPEPMQWYSYTQ